MKSCYLNILGAALIAQLLLAGCAGKSSETSVEVEEITGTPMLLSEDFEGGSCDFIFGDTLAFWSHNPGYLYTLAVFKGDSIISLGNACRRGQGPRECTFASMFPDKEGRLFSITSYGGNHAAINRHYASTADFVGDPLFIDSIAKSLDHGYNNIIPLSSDSIILVGGDGTDLKQIFSIIDLHNKKLIPLDYWPEDGFRGKDFIKAKLYINNARLFTDNKGKYVYCTGPNRNAFIFTIDGQHVNIIKTLFDNPIKYEEDKDGRNYRYHPEPEGLNMTATPNAIFFLMIDKDDKGVTAENFTKSHYGDTVLKYDWNGNLIKKYKLDRLVFGIDAGDNDSEFYCQATDPDTGETMMYRYSIK